VLKRDDIRPLPAGDVAYGGIRAQVYVHTIEHPAGLVLVDTGLIGTHPSLARWDLRPRPLPDALVRRVVAVVNTHLHFDHCGGNRLFPGTPIHVQRRELEDARRGGRDYVADWVDFAGATYIEHDGEDEILPALRLLPAPGHTAGHQVVLVEARDGPVVLGGDVAYSFRELGRDDTEGRHRVLELGALTYLAHVERPKVPERR